MPGRQRPGRAGSGGPGPADRLRATRSGGRLLATGSWLTGSWRPGSWRPASWRPGPGGPIPGGLAPGRPARRRPGARWRGRRHPTARAAAPAPGQQVGGRVGQRGGLWPGSAPPAARRAGFWSARIGPAAAAPRPGAGPGPPRPGGGRRSRPGPGPARAAAVAGRSRVRGRDQVHRVAHEMGTHHGASGQEILELAGTEAGQLGLQADVRRERSRACRPASCRMAASAGRASRRSSSWRSRWRGSARAG